MYELASMSMRQSSYWAMGIQNLVPSYNYVSRKMLSDSFPKSGSVLCLTVSALCIVFVGDIYFDCRTPASEANNDSLHNQLPRHLAAWGRQYFKSNRIL